VAELTDTDPDTAPEPLSPRITRELVDGPTLRTVRENFRVPIRKIAKWAGMSHGHLSKVERGEYGRPVTPAILSAYEKVIGVRITPELADQPPSQETRRAWQSADLGPVQQRRYVSDAIALGASGYLGESIGKLTDSAGITVEPPRLGIPEGMQLVHVARSLAGLDVQFAGVMAGPIAMVLTRWITKLTVLVPPEAPAVAPVHAALSLSAARAAWWKADIGSHAAARSLFKLAAYAAARSGDPDLRARALAGLSAHHARAGYPEGAIDVLRVAQGDERVSPEVRTLLTGVRQRTLDAIGGGGR
jgi:transcriptional regulator with XRE-family HTH domain